MGLVDYSSSSSSDTEGREDKSPPAKKQKRTSPSPPDTPTSTTTTTTPLPPLPASFHDLYAATVRPATGDIPSLHQGRRRAVPHVPGNWPSHVYVEWRPPPAEHQLLASLVTSVSQELFPPTETQEITSLLTSDLAAPLPLHISLSRPLALRTPDRDAFLADLARAVPAAAASFKTSCSLRVDGLGWFRSPDAARSFLVLRVRSCAPSSGRNPELAALLARCNACVAARGQPVLYAHKRRGEEEEGQEQQSARASIADDDDDDEEAGGGAGAGVVDVDQEAFHVSIAWSFAEPTEDLRARTAAVFARDEFHRGLVGGGDDEDGDGIRIPVDGVKVKIGNVITHIALAGGSGIGKQGGLFGI